MKSLILASIIVTTLVLNSYSQIVLKPTIGMNITDFSEKGEVEAKAKVGLLLGASIEFGKRFFIEPGIYYLRKSSTFSIPDSISIPNLDADIKGLRIPVAAGYYFIGDENTEIGFKGFGGPSILFITSSGDIDKNAVKNSSVGVFIGAGLNISKFFIDISYEWALTDILEDIQALDTGNSKSLFIQTGIRLNLD